MNDYTKPPLGANPAYISAEARIKELGEAIARASVEGHNYPGHISAWAEEIIWQCIIMDLADDPEHYRVTKLYTSGSPLL